MTNIQIDKLIIILIAVGIQFFTPVDEDLILWMPLAAGLLYFGPLFTARSSNRLRSEDKHAEVITKWHTLPDEELQSILTRITTERYGKINLPIPIKILSIFLRTPFVVIATIISIGIFFNDAPHLSALVFDIVCIPRALFFMVYGCSPADATKGFRAYQYELDGKVTTIKSLLEYKSYQTDYQPQVQVELSKQGLTTDIRNIRCNLVPLKKMPSLLCAQFSITTNKVREDTFPYAYLVFVFKGQKLASQKKSYNKNLPRHQRTSNEIKAFYYNIDQILENKAPNFSLEIKATDGNSIFVITKKRGSAEYHTNSVDCMHLAEATNDIFKYLSQSPLVEEDDGNV